MQLKSNKPCGVVHVEAGNDVYLPLEWTDVQADVVDLSAIVTITQHFWQYLPSGLSRAKYVFPVPSRAAVCGFEMVAADGTVITAVVKEKEAAQREHQAAIRQGFMTGLVEHVTDDIFSISLGALPAQQMVSTKITYVLDLMDDDSSDQVRLQLPMYIGMRYGALPAGMAGARVSSPHRIHISADIRMQGAIKKIASPTHPSVLTAPQGTTIAAQTARYTSPEFLTQDFVVVITAEGLDAPRCFAQRAPNGTVAMQLSIVPKFSLPSVPQQEYIFLVDRSGSMGGQRIETAARALVMLLRGLPTQGTWFNIFSFGSRADSLWGESVPYGEHSMMQATRYIDTMTANYGGTEMRGALEKVFLHRRTDVPTAVFVLTDGEAFDIDRTIQPVEQAVSAAKKGAPVRVFTLGIGETTSSALCEGMARAGNGLCLMATTAETIIGKCSRLVRASRTYILKNVSVDWGVRNDLAEAYRTGSTELKSVRQAPADISAIYPGNRFIVFALVEDASFTPPQEIVIRAQRDGQGEVLQFSVPVQVAAFPPEHHPQPLIQTLAARRAIMDIEDSARLLFAPDLKALIIRLGTQYQLASKFTSFIAVDKRTQSEVGEPPEEPVEEETFVPDEPIGFSPRGAPRARPTPFPPNLLRGGSSAMPRGTAVVQAQAQLQNRLQSMSVGGSDPATSSTHVPSSWTQNLHGQPFGVHSMASTSYGTSPAFAISSSPSPQWQPPTSWSTYAGAGATSLIGLPPPPPPPEAPTIHRSSDPYAPPPVALASGSPAPLTRRRAAPPPPPSRRTERDRERVARAAVPQLYADDSGEEEWDEVHTAHRNLLSADQLFGGVPTQDLAGRGADIGPSSTSLPQSPRTAEDRVVALVRLQSFDGSFPPDSRLLSLLGGRVSLAEANTLGVPEKIWATVLAIAYLKQHMEDQPELLEGLVEKANEFIAQTPGINIEALLSRAETILFSS